MLAAVTVKLPHSNTIGDLFLTHIIGQQAKAATKGVSASHSDLGTRDPFYRLLYFLAGP